jgi:uncharacterized protein YecE (DUF72 family)
MIRSWIAVAVKDIYINVMEQGFYAIGEGSMRQGFGGPLTTANGLGAFQFRDIHPQILLGTASDRYAGWLGQIYTRERYEGRTARRTNKVGGKSFVEETLPVESVEEYFEHFSVLEIDYTFYSLLLDEAQKPTQTYHVLRKYREHMKERDRVLLKVPQVVSAQKLRRGGQYLANETYLNAGMFTERFHGPALEILGAGLAGMIFEQEYQRKQDRVPAGQVAEALDRFFESVPKDTRYHLELRTDSYLSAPVFEVLERHGVGQALSHWTWLPPLRKQLAKADHRVFNGEKRRIVRLMTPIGTRYEDAYAKAHPFDKLIEGMLQPQMLRETADLMHLAIQDDIQTMILINNRAGGNAPMIAQRLVEAFLKQEVAPSSKP